jgi:hypothetical protein
MSELKVNSKLFQFPDPGKEPNYGKEVTNWAKEVTNVLDSSFGLGTITETQSIIENNISSLNQRSVAGLIFNNNLVKSAAVFYRIYRKTQLTSEAAEEGVLNIHYSEIDPLNKWSITREITNGEPALVYFDIDNTGQVKYYSSDKLLNITDNNYEGFIRFKTTGIIK